MNIGRQIHNIEKAFNTLHGGFTRKDDYPPKRFWDEPVKSGPYKGECLDHDIWNRTLDEYYTLHGWDVETGLQKRETLEKIGLREVSDRLGTSGLLR
jgi:aldehyde:ferredoxin oxidoreductase